MYTNIYMCIWRKGGLGYKLGRKKNRRQSHNILHKVLTIGHRFGRRSGPDGNSGRNPTTFLYGIAFLVYLAFSKIA